MADNFSSFNQRLRYAHYRPSLPVKSDPKSWWKYAYKVLTHEMKKARYMGSTQHLCGFHFVCGSCVIVYHV